MNNELLVKPPQAPEIEAAILGAMLIESEAVPKALEILTPECFYLPQNRKIFSAMTKLFETGKPVDAITIYEELSKRGEIENIGGITYLSKLTLNIISSANILHHSKIVLEKYILRGLIASGQQITAMAYEGKEDVFEIVEQAEKKIFSITQMKIGSYLDLKTCVGSAITDIEKIMSGKFNNEILTGFYDLDEYNVLEKSALTILAARPSIGKTALALKIARNIAPKMPIGIFSLEMSQRQLTLRYLSIESRLTYSDIAKGKVYNDNKSKLVTASIRLSDLNIYIDDTPSMSITQIRSKARKMKTEKKIGLLIIDYLQLAHAKAESREKEIATISASLKQIAKELDIPVLALAQLNRAAEIRSDKKPSLSDLRESGAIEQDADVVMLLHRPEFYKIKNLEDGTDTEGLAQVIIPKNRNGATGEIDLIFEKEYANFENKSRNPRSDFYEMPLSEII